MSSFPVLISGDESGLEAIGQLSSRVQGSDVLGVGPSCQGTKFETPPFQAFFYPLLRIVFMTSVAFYKSFAIFFLQST